MVSVPERQCMLVGGEGGMPEDRKGLGSHCLLLEHTSNDHSALFLKDLHYFLTAPCFQTSMPTFFYLTLRKSELSH